MLIAIGCPLALLLPCPSLAREFQQPLTLERIPTGMNGLVELAFAPGDDAGRVFVVRKDGMIFLVEDDAWPSSPFLDIRHKVASPGSQGLLGVAFHPSYEQNGYFYVNYTESSGGDTVIERYSADPANRNFALPGSGLRIIEIAQPDPVHNGGWLEFGPDGYLYIAMGDGGPTGDPAQRAQNGGELLGKILRLDVDHPSAGLEYGIPSSNPFMQDPAVRDKIWALGLRNPWRCDFDSATGDLWITDVGDARWEEIDLQPAGLGGSNYGWSIVEGNQCFNPPSNCNPAGLRIPIYEYDHGGSPYRCSIIGGVVYRGSQMADMHGRFFFADYCSNQTWSLREQGGQVQDLVEHTAELTTPSGGGLSAIVALGEDADGEIYVLQGPEFELCRIVPAGLRMRLPRLSAGGSVVVPAVGGTPHASTGLFYSLTGLGVTFLPGGGASLGIDRAKLLATTVTDGSGGALFPGTVPARLLNRTIWLQVAQRGEVSNVGVRIVR